MGSVPESIYFSLRTSQVILRTALSFHFLCLVLWALETLVQGFGEYDAMPPAGFHAINHVGFWLPIEMFVWFFGQIAITFEMDLMDDSKQWAVTFARTAEFLVFWMVLLVFAIAANIVHIVAAALELSDCRTTLCMLNSGFLIALIVILGIIILLEVIEIYHAWRYKKRLGIARPFIVFRENSKKRR